MPNRRSFESRYTGLSDEGYPSTSQGYKSLAQINPEDFMQAIRQSSSFSRSHDLMSGDVLAKLGGLYPKQYLLQQYLQAFNQMSPWDPRRSAYSQKINELQNAVSFGPQTEIESKMFNVPSFIQNLHTQRQQQIRDMLNQTRR